MFRGMANPFRARPLSRVRISLAFAVALVVDTMQIGLGPLGWAFADEALDVIAMIATSLVLGFHPLLLPTFVVEFIPLVDMLPTWTGCVGAVVLLRKRSPTETPAGKVSDGPGPVIDI